MNKLFFASTLLLFLSNRAFSQEHIPMADGMRAEGKIYVVVAIMLVIFIGIIVYLFSIERKINKLEKEIKSKA